MSLDKRQRAMLREMGVQVWWPMPEQAAAAGPAAPAPALDATPAAAPAPVQAAAPAARAPEPARSPAPAAPAPQAAAAAHSWRVGQAQMLTGQDDAAAEQGPRWLLLAEGRPDELVDGAGQLLRNMLRAARLHQGAQVWMAPMQRAPGTEVQGLDEVLERTEPDVVFIMSRLGAQALLETDEPLGRLRGQVHDLWGMPAVVSYDLGALMRTPMEKAKAWDDLCLALQVARAQHAERMDAQ